MPLSTRMPDLVALEVLLAISRSGSLSAAGRELGMTQQAVSARVSALEAQTGARLVTRTTHGSQLTAAGVVAAQWADRLLQVAEEVDTGLAALRADSRSRVRVSASLTVAEHLLPGWLVALHASRPAGPPIDVVLTATNSDHVLDQVRDGAADLGFVEGPSAPRGLRSRIVARDELVLVVPPGHAWSRRSRPVPAAELDATALVSREAGSGTRESLTRALVAALGPDHGRTPPAFELSTTSAVRAAVLAGSAPAVLSRLAVRDDLGSGRLRVVPVADLDLRRALRAVWSGERTPPAGGVRDLLAHIARVSP